VISASVGADSTPTRPEAALVDYLGTALTVILTVLGAVTSLDQFRKIRCPLIVLIIAFGIASAIYTQITQSEVKDEMYNRLIGGNDYCYLSVGNPNETPVAYVWITHEGRYPLHSVSIRIYQSARAGCHSKRNS